MFIGIDPGVNGAIALISPKNGFVEFHDMPKIEFRKGRNKISASLLLDILQEDGLVERVFVEQLHAMPMNGSITTFPQGHSMGVIETAVALLRYPITLIAPAKWKTAQGLKGAPKDASRLKALELYPQTANDLKRKKDIDRAEALLIADYGFRQVAAGLL